MAQELKEGRISLLELPGLPIKADWNLIWLKQKKHSPAVKAFIRLLSENRKKYCPNTFQPWKPCNSSFD
jgi:DNA-binding transcriptional LysR family regulator